MRAWQVAELVEGTLTGDAQAEVADIAPLQQARAGQLTFLIHPRNISGLAASRATVLLTSPALWQASGHSGTGITVILTPHPTWAMARVYQTLRPPRARSSGIDARASVHPSAQVSASAYVGPLAVVEAHATIGPQAQLLAQSFVGEHAVVGARTVLHPGARLLWGCTLGDDVLLHAGSVVGADGFGLAQSPHGPEQIKVPQLGHVEVGDWVELGANSTIDRGTFGATVIGTGCKIDNLVQIGHNVVLGAHCVVVSQTGIAGSSVLGDRVTVGAQGGIVGHVHIAANTVLAARTGVINSLPEAGVYAGAPAMEHRAWLRMVAAMRDLPALRKRLSALTRMSPPATKAH